MTPQMTAASHSCRQRISRGGAEPEARARRPRSSARATPPGRPRWRRTRRACGPPRWRARTGPWSRSGPARSRRSAQAAQERPREAGAARVRDLPRRVERVLHGVRHAPARRGTYRPGRSRGRARSAGSGRCARAAGRSGGTGSARSSAAGAAGPGLFFSTMSSTVTSTSISGKMRTKANQATSRARLPAWSSPNFFHTATGKASQACCCWYSSTARRSPFGHVHREEDVPGLSASIRRKSDRVTAGHHGIAGDVLQAGATN